MLAGAGLLWMGWSGFNGGGPFMASTIASLAILNTHVCTAASIIVWVLLDTFYFGKPTVFGAVQGMITGLVCITPAAGTHVSHYPDTNQSNAYLLKFYINSVILLLKNWSSSN